MLRDDQSEPTRIAALIADDDPIFCAVASAALRRCGHVPTIAADGAAAWEALLANTYDVALVDLSMPHIDGFRLIALVRSTPRIAHLPIVVLTVRSDIEAIDEALDIGANGYLTKPVNWQELNNILLDLTSRTMAPSTSTVGQTR